MSLRLPLLNGVAASQLQLPPGAWTNVLDGLCAHFVAIGRDEWLQRFARSRVLDEHGEPLDPQAPYRVGRCVYYYREIAAEPRIPFVEDVLHVDSDLVVADKPHFLPVIPTGEYVEETLLARLLRRFDNADLVPLHRIDRATAGLVLFSANPATRARYQALFREQRIVKRYEAIAPALPGLTFPLRRATRLSRGEPFFRMCETDGIANSETRIEVLDRGDALWRYALYPRSGRKHQLRVHMAALGAPIVNDAWYPSVCSEKSTDDYARPLQLLARSLDFIDPIDGTPRHFESRLQLGEDLR